MGAGKSGNFGNTKGSSLDALSNLLTAASLIPGLDTFTNLASIPIDLARGDFLSAGLSAVGIIPVVGEVADTAKLAKMADKAVDAAKVADRISDAAKSVKRISPSKLTQTHKLTLSKKQYSNLVESIRKNGMRIKSLKMILGLQKWVKFLGKLL